jgi:hypothetical protein
MNDRISQPPASIEQARTRLLAAMNLLEANCRDGIDVSYANECFNEAMDDYFQMVYYGDVDEGRQRALEAQIWELEARTAVLAAEQVVHDALRDLDDGER